MSDRDSKRTSSAPASVPSQSPLVRVGYVIDGKYELERRLGRGGMGSVWAGRHVELGHRVAIKLISPTCAASPSARQRFTQEAKAAARLTSRHVARVFDNGELEDGTPYIVMEYLEGVSLSRRLRERRLTVHEAVLVAWQVGHALREAHAAGIVHRDIKPENIFIARSVDEEGFVAKVLDFGVAKLMSGCGLPEGAASASGSVVGTPRYMSPEQARGLRDVDHRSDLYSLGAVVFAMLTGRHMIQGELLTELLSKIVSGPLPDLMEVEPTLPPDLGRWFAKACARQPDQRFQRIDDMTAQLLKAAGIRRSELGRNVFRPAGAAPGEPQSDDDAPTMLDGPGRPEQTGRITKISNADELASQTVAGSALSGTHPLRVARVPRWAWAAGAGAALFAVAVVLAVRFGNWKLVAAERAQPAASGAAPAQCEGTLAVRILTDLSGATKSVATPYFYGEYDYLRELRETGGLRGCSLDVQYADYNYDAAEATRIYRRWKADPRWENVTAIFGFGSGDTLKVGALAAADQRPIVSASYLGELASPLPQAGPVEVPELSAAFVETTFRASKQTPGHRFNFFAGTDYSTGARIAMFYVRSAGGKRVAFFHCTAPYCTGPLAAAKTYAQQKLGLAIGRDLVIELTDDQPAIDRKVQAYFDEEAAHRKQNPDYAPVDWIWMGNSTNTTAQLARALHRLRVERKLKVQLIVNNWGFDENLAAECGDACVDWVHGIMPFAAFGDRRAEAMDEVVRLHDKWRKSDADGVVPADYRNVRYVQGYVSALLWRLAVERVLEAGKPVDGMALRDAFESFEQVDTGGLTAPLTFHPEDHRPQSSESIYKISAEHTLVFEPPARQIYLERDWLGW